jgi:putative PIN family toxin of toxin-antitoxin system
MIRVVLDTNILVSALLSPLGPPAQLYVLALSGSIQMCVSGSVYAEYEEVLHRPRLKRDPKIVVAALGAIRERALWVKPSSVVRACADRDDDVFLECAEAAAANFVVTGNLRHFPEAWGNIRVVTARALLDLLVSPDPLN